MILNEPTLFSEENIRKIEETREATFVCESQLKNVNGYWSDDLYAAIFYTNEAYPEGSNYFALYFKGDELMITDGICATEEFTGIQAENGDIIYSRYRHDYRVSPDKTVTIDGGRNYVHSSFKTGNAPNYAILKIEKDRLIVDRLLPYKEWSDSSSIKDDQNEVIKLFLDDMRQPPDDSWKLVETVKDCIHYLNTKNVKELSLDHDLGFTHETGYDILLWIEEQMVNNNYVPPEVIKVHSSNPPAHDRMKLAIEAINKLRHRIK